MATMETAATQRLPRFREPLAGAYFWLAVFFVIYCARPEDWIPGLAFIPLAKISGVLAVLALVFAIGRVRGGVPREMIFLLLLLLQLFLTVPFSPVWHGGAFFEVLEFSKVVIIMLVMVLAVNSLARLRRLVFIQSASVAVISLAAIVKGRSVLGRLEGALNGIYSNPNDLAFAIVLTLPLCFVFFLRTSNFLVKAAWTGMMVAMVYAVFLTASRAGILALTVTAIVAFWEFGVRGRRPLLVIMGVVTLFAALALAGGDLIRRFQVMSGGQLSRPGDMAALESAAQRRLLLIRSLEVIGEHPLFGVGPGNFQVVSGVWRETHNSYTQIGSEAGIPGLILFVLILWSAFTNLRRARRRLGWDCDPRDDLRLLAGGLRASLVGFVVGAFFASVAYHFFPYFLVGYTAALAPLCVRNAPEDATRLASQRAAGRESRAVIYTRRRPFQV
jgi:O-antigen ligase